MSEGYKRATFFWRNFDGNYDYSIREVEPGMFEVFYQEGEKKEDPVFRFSDLDGYGLLSVMKDALDYAKKNNAERPQDFENEL